MCRSRRRKMNTIVLNCLVERELPKNVFPVRIRKNETIGDLKIAIKAEKAVFDIYGASDLRLWEANVQLGRSIPLDSKHLLDASELVAVEKIGKYWCSSRPIKGNLHVIIKTPGM